MFEREKSLTQKNQSSSYCGLYHLKQKTQRKKKESEQLFKHVIPAGNCMFKVNNKNTRTRCEICQWGRSVVFIVNSEHISHLVLVFLFSALTR